MALKIYTDGACRGNPGPGGWAAVLCSGEELRELSGYDPSTTNNRMELTAAIEGLAATPAGTQAQVITDSRYLLDGITRWAHEWRRRGWRKADRKPVLNQDLWQRLLGEVESREVSWKWVEGHSGHEENERCDRLANVEIDRHAGESR